MTSWAKVGAKVVCVNDDPKLMDHVLPPGSRPSGDMHGLQEGQIYTIRAVQIDEISGTTSFLLREIVRPVRGTRTREPGYAISRFRPLITKTQEQDVEMFKSILTKSPEPV